AKEGVKFDYNFAAIRDMPEGDLRLRCSFDPRISILKLFPGITKETVRAVKGTRGWRSVELESYGAGNAPNLPWLVAELEQAIQSNVIVLNISQCPGGMVMQGRYETSKDLLRIGVIGGSDLTTEAAVTKLMILLGEHEQKDVARLVQESLAG